MSYHEKDCAAMFDDTIKQVCTCGHGLEPHDPGFKLSNCLHNWTPGRNEDGTEWNADDARHEIRICTKCKVPLLKHIRQFCESLGIDPKHRPMIFDTRKAPGS